MHEGDRAGRPAGRAARRHKIEKVSVSGRSATAEVKGRQPELRAASCSPIEASGWKISYPPGLQTKSGGEPGPAPGVPLGAGSEQQARARDA